MDFVISTRDFSFRREEIGTVEVLNSVLVFLIEGAPGQKIDRVLGRNFSHDRTEGLIDGKEKGEGSFWPYDKVGAPCRDLMRQGAVYFDSLLLIGRFPFKTLVNIALDNGDAYRSMSGDSSFFLADSERSVGNHDTEEKNQEYGDAQRDSAGFSRLEKTRSDQTVDQKDQKRDAVYSGDISDLNHGDDQVLGIAEIFPWKTCKQD